MLRLVNAHDAPARQESPKRTTRPDAPRPHRAPSLRLAQQNRAPGLRPAPRTPLRPAPRPQSGPEALVNIKAPRPARRTPGGPGELLGRNDPRWLLATRVALALDGGRAAVLSPERRERLLKTAKTLGLRPFDAALVIAMVQDTARRGAVPEGMPPLTPDLAEALARLPAPGPAKAPRQEVSILQRAIGVLIVAASLFGAAVLWLNGAPPA